MGNKKVLTVCEVCGEEKSCTETDSGMYVCGSACRMLADRFDSRQPVDTMFGILERSYYNGEAA